MKHDVHMFAVVRVKCVGIKAESHDAAVQRAMDRFQELYSLFETRNFQSLPNGVTDVEFGEEFSHFLVDDDTGAEEFSGSTWHDGDGNPESVIVEKPLSAQEFRSRIGPDGRVQLAIALSLKELRDCDQIDGLNELVDSRVYGTGVHGYLTDLVCRPSRVKDERVVIEMSAATNELGLDDLTNAHTYDEPDGRFLKPAKRKQK